MKYVASVRDKMTKKLMIIEQDYNRKSDFYKDLRDNDYSVRFITTPEKFDEDCEKWHERNELNKRVRKNIYAMDKAHAEKLNMSVTEYRKWFNN